MSTPTSKDVYIETGQSHSHKAAPHHWLQNRLAKVGKVVKIVLWAFLLFCWYFPLTVLSITFTGKIRSHHLWDGAASQRKEEEKEQRPSPSSKPIYKKKRQTEHVQTVIQNLGMVVATRLGVVGILWLAINFSVPSLRDKAQVMGDPLWKWSVLVILIFLLIPSMLIVSYIINKSLEWGSDDDIDLRLYWLKGVSQRMRRVLYFALILLMWILYFTIKPPPERIHNKIYGDIHKYITLTLLVFLLWAVVGLVGNIVVLRWKSRIIYDRNKARILVATFRLYLLHLLFGQIQKDVNSAARWILLPYLDDRRKPQLEDAINSVMAEEDLKVTSLGAPVRHPPIERFMDQMSACVSLYDIHEAVEWFQNQNFDFSQDEIPDIRQLLPAIRKKYGSNEIQEMTEMIADVIIAGLVPEDIFLRETLVKLLSLDLRKEAGEKISWKSIEDWMIFAHKKCFTTMLKIHTDLQVAYSLDKLLSSFQIVASFILWLFLMKLATTKLIITVGSLFISFMFTETFRTFIQGVIFSFVIHPFDVGDRVKINNIELEVQSIHMLTTRFLIMENPKDQIIIYPNFVMAKEKIIIFKREEGFSRKKSPDETNKDDQTPSKHDDDDGSEDNRNESGSDDAASSSSNNVFLC